MSIVWADGMLVCYAYNSLQFKLMNVHHWYSLLDTEIPVSFQNQLCLFKVCNFYLSQNNPYQFVTADKDVILSNLFIAKFFVDV